MRRQLTAPSQGNADQNQQDYDMATYIHDETIYKSMIRHLQVHDKTTYRSITRKLSGPWQDNLQVNDKKPTGPQHDNLHIHDKTTYKSIG